MKEKSPNRKTNRPVAILLLVIVTSVIWTWPWLTSADLYRNRDIAWDVYVEDPIRLDAVEAIMNIFSAEVRDIFSIPIVETRFWRIPDDGKDNYSSWHSSTYRRWSWLGPVRMSVAFLTGTGWRPEEGRPVLGRGQAPPYLTTFWGDFSQVGIEFYSRIKLCCSRDQVRTLLHEFGHNLGFKDLYRNNSFGIAGCEEHAVIMSKGAYPEAEYRPPTGELAFHYEELNSSEIPTRLVVTETYFESTEPRLTQVVQTFRSNGSQFEFDFVVNYSYGLTSWRWNWTQEQLQLLDSPYTSDSSCVQEGIPSRSLSASLGAAIIVAGASVELVLFRDRIITGFERFLRRRR